MEPVQQDVVCIKCCVCRGFVLTHTPHSASATANNGVCGAGTAPRSKVSGIRLIAANTDDADEAEGLHFGVLNNQNHVFTSSWGPYDDAQRLEGEVF
jgi:hypothetical protein